MNRTGSMRIASTLVAFAGLYVAAYLLSTDVHHGRLDTTRYRIRLFHSNTHLRVFQPLVLLENGVSPSNREFAAQVSSGASLPPAE